MELRRIIRRAIFLLALSITLLIPYVAKAVMPTTRTVCAGGGCDYTDIQSAINASSLYDTVLVSDGTYNITAPIDFLGKRITVESVNGAASTIIDANQTGSVVSFTNSEPSDSVLDGFTVTGGLAASGAGVYILGASPTITNCVISENEASSGGGFYSAGGSIPTITNCTITQNSATTTGGGFYIEGNVAVITNCLIYDNIAAHGGGLHSAGGGPTFTNCTIYANTATSTGGAIRTSGHSTTTIINSTITDNISLVAGGGGVAIYTGDALTVANSIIWNNRDSIGTTQIYNYGGTVTVKYSNIGPSSSWDGVNENISADPDFVDDQTNDYHLKPESPCIDTGGNSAATGVTVPTTDRDGDARPLDSGYEMGSDETTTWLFYKDIDDDDYTDGTTQTASTRPTGYKLLAELSVLTPDCNDADAAINPGKDEICGDGIDQNCSGADETCVVVDDVDCDTDDNTIATATTIA
ncbi:MopE-related protein, partial [Thermodesulfobacteriota bacterium]